MGYTVVDHRESGSMDTSTDLARRRVLLAEVRAHGGATQEVSIANSIAAAHGKSSSQGRAALRWMRSGSLLHLDIEDLRGIWHPDAPDAPATAAARELLAAPHHKRGRSRDPMPDRSREAILGYLRERLALAGRVRAELGAARWASAVKRLQEHERHTTQLLAAMGA